MKRIKRDQEERVKWDLDQLATERRRTMTDAEITLENIKNPKPAAIGQKKSQYRFLQKYYHHGAFYLDENDSVFQRDFSAPTGADRTVDRTLLPKVMQVKKFGIKGRTKYTHLVDQDTTKYDKNPWTGAQRITGPVDVGLGTAGSGTIKQKERKLAGTGGFDSIVKHEKDKNTK